MNARIHIVDDGYGRLCIRWYARDSGLWHRILNDFKATFRTHSERSYNSTTRTWSVPLWHRRRLEEWADYWFDADAQQWDEDDDNYDYGRTDSDRSYGQYRRPQTSTSAIAAAFSVLCLTPQAPDGLVDAAYRWWSKAAHPDLGGDGQVMVRVNEAVATIRAHRQRRAS